MADQTNTKFCGECGEVITSVAKFCSVCGADQRPFEVLREDQSTDHSSSPEHNDKTDANKTANARTQEVLDTQRANVEEARQRRLIRAELNAQRLRGEDKTANARPQSDAKALSPDTDSPPNDPPTKEALEIRTASSFRRATAWLLDMVGYPGLFGVIAGACTWFAWLVGASMPLNIGPFEALILGIAITYPVNTGLELFPGSAGGGSLGKRALNLRIQSWPYHSGGSSLTAQLWGRLLLRQLLFVIPFVNIICLIALGIDKNKRSWYDKAAGTVVVKL